MVFKNASQLGSSVIRGRAKSVADVTSKETKKMVTNLIDSMRHHGLVGMAAPQIGKGMRIFVTEIRKTKSRKPKEFDTLRIFINPEISFLSKTMAVGWEGCGSVAAAGLFGLVKRPKSLTVSAYDCQGARFEMKAAGLLARIIQHEMDHLNGKVFTDIADPKSYMSRNEYVKMRDRKK